jgi:hypothetical protein
MDSRADRVAILIALGTALCIAAIFVPRFVRPYPCESETPQVPSVSNREAEAIALAEVKKREGWSGNADDPTEGHLSWQVVVRRKPGPTKEWRWITITSDRTIVGYEIRTEWLP